MLQNLNIKLQDIQDSSSAVELKLLALIDTAKMSQDVKQGIMVALVRNKVINQLVLEIKS